MRATQQEAFAGHLSHSNINLLSIPLRIEQRKSHEHAALDPVKFYLLNWTSQLIPKNETAEMSEFYQNNLNEYSGEMWLYRGFDGLSYEQGHTSNQTEAQVVLIPALLHFWKRQEIKVLGKRGRSKQTNNKDENLIDVARSIRSAIRYPEKPHVLLVPAVNPGESRTIQLRRIVEQLQYAHVNLFSVAYERNKFWQQMEPHRMIPIPYVVRLDTNDTVPQHNQNTGQRQSDFVFYSGSPRKMSNAWGGCDRTMVEPLKKEPNMHVELVRPHTRLSQAKYNKFMNEKADYCLILCGDTVTSRSLASSIVSGCIPVRVGSRLRGFCEPPCHRGWGWTVTNGLSHLPFADVIDWQLFPEVDEQAFASNPRETLVQQVFQKYNETQKMLLRSRMQQIKSSFVYGWGNPVTSSQFGDAIPFIWKSIQSHLNLTGHS